MSGTSPDNIIPLTQGHQPTEHQFHSVALFGANGQIGTSILQALVNCQQQSFRILAFVPPDTPSPQHSVDTSKANEKTSIEVKTVDLTKVSRSDLAEDLKRADVVVSALNGKALESQKLIQDAGVDAGVRRIYPSEYGMHHVYTQKDGSGWVHPMWNMKSNANEEIIMHPAIFTGKMSYTLIGCGDYYNQDREPIWCPWTQKPASEWVKNGTYTLHVIGDADATADFTHLDDFAEFLVATLCHAEKSENRRLNVVSDSISHAGIARLLEKHTGTKVQMQSYSFEAQREILHDPKSAPKELRDRTTEGGEGQSSFPVDFWFLVKGMQGAGRFRWPAGERHEKEFGLDPSSMRSFEWYLRDRYGSRS